MSHRTIVEFNHDYVQDLYESPERQAAFFKKLMMNDWSEFDSLAGIRKLGERHHSETLKLTVK